ncbi:MAG TPA: hypothetical protein VHR18_10665 [Solirubrobacterales bacterium]|jgi:hypothetical protein|nr:hypothetical protein [Solirubrobacterales bacterium]
MAKDGSENDVSWFRHPLRASGAWLDQPERTRRESLLIGIVGTLLVTAVFAVAGLALAGFALVDLSGEVPVWIAVSFGVLALALGAVGGPLAVRRYYHVPRHRLETLEEELRQAEGQVEKARDEIADLKPHRDIRERIESYAEQIRLLLSRGLGTGLENVEEELLVEPARLMEEVAGCRVNLSIWEPETASDGSKRWRISHRADHSDRECNAFGVPLDASWIASDQKLRPDDAVFGISDLVAKKDVPGDDLTALRREGFKALLCSRVATGPLTGHRRENTACLVALAREPRAFSQVEGRYLQFLGRLLSLHFQITDLLEMVQGEPGGPGEVDAV